MQAIVPPPIVPDIVDISGKYGQFTVQFTVFEFVYSKLSQWAKSNPPYYVSVDHACPRVTGDTQLLEIILCDSEYGCVVSDCTIFKDSVALYSVRGGFRRYGYDDLPLDTVIPFLTYRC